MNRTLPRAALALLAISAPLAAQDADGRLPPSCKRERVEAERPLRGRAATEDSTRRAIRGAAMAELRSAADVAGVAQLAGLVLLMADEDRRVADARVFGSNVPESVAKEVAQRVLPRLAAWPERGRVLVNLRLDSVAVPEAPAGSMQVICTPALVNRLVVQQRLQAFASSTPNIVQSTAARRGTSMRMLLSRDGQVLHAELARTSGDVRLDRMAMSLASEMRFSPASVGAVPQDVWLVMPIGVLAHPTDTRGRGRGIP